MKFTVEQLEILGEIFNFAFNWIEHLKNTDQVYISIDDTNNFQIFNLDKKQKEFEELAKDIQKQLNTEEL